MQNFIGTAAGILLGVSVFGFWSNLPHGDLMAAFDADAVWQAIGNGEMNLLLLTLYGFGIGVSSNYAFTSLGRLLGYGAVLGTGIVVAVGILVFGVLIVGLLADVLQSVTVPVVQNAGMGLATGSAAGLWIAKREQQPKASALALAVIFAMLVGCGLLVLRSANVPVDVLTPPAASTTSL